MSGATAVSVVLPTHNRSALLRRSIRSVLCQSYADFELLVVDDASDDDTREVVESFSDERIRYIRLDSNVGGGAARTAGVSQARASILAFQDNDDQWLPQKLERCMQVLGDDPSLTGVFSAFWQIEDGSERRMPVSVPRGEEMAGAILHGNFIDTPTSVIRRDAFERAGGFDPRMPRYQDWELFIRLLKCGPFAYIEEPLVLSHVTPGSISSSDSAHGLALEIMYEKHVAEIARDDRLHANWLANLGDSQMRAGRVEAGRRNLLRSWRLRPFRPGIAVRWLTALVGGQMPYVLLSRYVERCRRGR
ncbi:MAG: glycosyltransferase family 2 protein [Pseudomonadota bacterium]